MSDEQLDDRVTGLAVTQEDVDQLDVGVALADLKDAIMATPTRHEHPARHPGPVRLGSRSRWFATAAAAAVVAVALVVIQPLGGGGGGAWATALVQAAENSPLLLLDADGWSVERADIYWGDEGEMTFVNGDASLDLHWRDGAAFDQYVEDRSREAVDTDTTTVLGNEAHMFLYAGGGNDWTTLFYDGRYTIEVRGVFDDTTLYRSLLDSLVEVDVDTWLSAMPDSVIASADRPAAVRQMLADIPLPEDFDTTALEEGPLRERYQLGAEVAGAVACAWIERWVDATERGNQSAADNAAAALSTSRGWSILQEMTDFGFYPEVLWEYVDAVNGDGTVTGGRELSVESSYRPALGCDLAG